MSDHGDARRVTSVVYDRPGNVTEGSLDEAVELFRRRLRLTAEIPGPATLVFVMRTARERSAGDRLARDLWRVGERPRGVRPPDREVGRERREDHGGAARGGRGGVPVVSEHLDPSGLRDNESARGLFRQGPMSAMPPEMSTEMIVRNLREGLALHFTDVQGGLLVFVSRVGTTELTTATRRCNAFARLVSREDLVDALIALSCAAESAHAISAAQASALRRVVRP